MNTPQPSGADGLARRGGLALVGILAQGLSRFLTALLVGNVAGPVVLGHVTTALSAANLLSFFWPTTSGSAAAKFVARADGAGSDAGEATVRFVRTRVLQATVVLGAAGLGGWLVWTHGTPSDALIVGLLTVACCLYPLCRGVLLANSRLRRSAVLDVIAAVVAVGGVGLLLLLGVRGQVLLIPMAVGLFVYVGRAWPRGQGNLTRQVRREIDGFVFLGTVGTLCSVGFLQLSVLAARSVGGPFAAGQYSSALAIATPAALAANALGMVLFPEMSRAHGRGDRRGIADQARKATTALVLFLAPVVATVALASPLIFSVLWGPEFTQGVVLLPVLLVGVVVTAMATPSVNSLTSGDQSGLRFTTSLGLVGAGLGIVLWFVLTPHLGILGVAIGYALGTGVAAAGSIVAASRRHGLHWGGLWYRTFGYAVVVAAVCLLPATAQVSLPWRLVQVTTCWGVWFGLNHREVGVLAGWVLRPRPAR